MEWNLCINHNRPFLTIGERCPYCGSKVSDELTLQPESPGNIVVNKYGRRIAYIGRKARLVRMGDRFQPMIGMSESDMKAIFSKREVFNGR